MPEPRPEPILRERLVRAVEAATRRPLTVLCAPAGYGKTTALVQWLERTGVDHVWLSLDASDNDPSRYGSRLPASLDGGRLGGRLAVILDDYHVIESERCHELTTRLLDRLPPDGRVVIATRTVPPSQVASWRSARARSELGPPQLRFRADETEGLLNDSLSFALTAAQIELIDERVQGWPAGVALIATALHDHLDPAGLLDVVAASRARLEAYLTEEVLDAARPQLRVFLCRTSVLTVLNPLLCEAVFGDRRARDLLDEVRRLNLVVAAVDTAGGWLRYHPVLRDTLLGELERREPELVGELHTRASAWFEVAGMPDEALEHALQAGDGPRAGRLLSANWLRLVNERRHVTLRQILDRMPADRGEHGPLCEALGVFCAALEGVDQRIAREHAAMAADALLGTTPTPAELRVLALLDSNRTWADVARELYLSPNTVKSHARRLYRRFGQHTRAGLVAAARARGMLPPQTPESDR